MTFGAADQVTVRGVLFASPDVAVMIASPASVEVMVMIACPSSLVFTVFVPPKVPRVVVNVTDALAMSSLSWSYTVAVSVIGSGSGNCIDGSEAARSMVVAFCHFTVVVAVHSPSSSLPLLLASIQAVRVALPGAEEEMLTVATPLPSVFAVVSLPLPEKVPLLVVNTSGASGTGPELAVTVTVMVLSVWGSGTFAGKGVRLTVTFVKTYSKNLAGSPFTLSAGLVDKTHASLVDDAAVQICASNMRAPILVEVVPFGSAQEPPQPTRSPPVTRTGEPLSEPVG